MLTPTLNLPTITQEVALNTIRFNRNLGATQTRIAQFARSMTDIGVSLSLAVSIPLQLMATAAIKSYATLEQAATKAASRVQGASQGMTAAIMGYTQLLSQKYPISPAEIASGIEELVKAGATLPQAMRAIPTFMKFSVAGGLELNKTVTDLMGVFYGFGMATGDFEKDLEQIGHVQDVIAKTADITKASYESMVEAFTHGGASISKIMGISFEETAAILGAFHQAGIEGTRAGTFLTMMMRDLTAAALKNAPVWEKLGVAVYDTNHQLMPAEDIVKGLQDALTKLNPEAARLALLEMGIPSRSMQATLALFGLTDQVKKLQEEIKGAGGYVEGVFKFQMTSLTNQMTLLKNQFIGVAVSVGQILVPMLFKAGGAVQYLIGWWDNLSMVQKQNIVHWAVLASVLGPVLLLFGIAIRVIGVLASAVQFLSVGLWVLIIRYTLLAVSATVAWLAQLGPIGWVIVAVLGVAAALGSLSYDFETLKIVAGKTLDYINEKMTAMMNKMTQGAFNVSPNSMKMQQKSLMYDMVLGNSGIKDPKVQAYVIEDSVKKGVISAFEAKGLLDLIKAQSDMAAGFTKAHMPEFGTGEFEAEEDDKKKKTVESSMRGFSAKELGSEEEYQARISGQQQLVGVAERTLQVNQQNLAVNQRAAGDLSVIKKNTSAKKPDLIPG